MATGSLNARHVIDQRLLVSRIIGEDKVRVYANDTARDAAIASPSDGLIVYNAARSALQISSDGEWRDISLAPPAVNHRVAPPIMTHTLSTGAAFESWTNSANYTDAADTSNFRFGTQGVKFTSSGAVSAEYQYLDPLPQADPVLSKPAQAVCLWLYVDAGARLDRVDVIAYTATGLGSFVSGTTQGTFVDGWNFVRLYLGSSTMANLANGIYRLAIRLDCSDAINVTVGHIYLECPRKARCVMVADGAYETFYTEAWPEFQARGWPTCWAPNPTKWGDSGGIKDTMTLAQFNAMLAADVCGDEVSFHSWDRTETAAKTAAQIREDTYKSIRHIQSQWPDRYTPWRAAWTSNNAAEHAVVQDCFLCYATAQTATGQGMLWPPNEWPEKTDGLHRYNLPRWAVMNDAATTGVIDRIQYGHIPHIFYMHGVSSGVDPTNDATPTYFASWLSQMDTLVAGGHLEFVTMRQLLQDIGVFSRPSFSADGAFEVANSDASHARFNFQ